MHYVKQFKINGIDSKQVACIELRGAPNTATEGAVGVLGIDVTSPTHKIYKCVAVNGSIYTWEELQADKLDKVTTGVDWYSQVYAVKYDGSQYMIKASSAGAQGSENIKLTDTDGNLKLPDQTEFTPGTDHAVSKRWVDKCSDLSKRVRSLENALIYFEQNDSTATTKNVPLNSGHTAYLNSIKGKSVPSKNKFDPREFPHASTIDSDGTISFYRDSEYDEPYSMWLTLPAGTWTVAVYNSTEDGPDGNPYEKFSLTFANTWQGETITNNDKTVVLDKPTQVQLDYGMLMGRYWCKFQVMLNEGDTALPYEPYGYLPTVVTAVKSYSANLIPYPYAQGGAGTVHEFRGVTYTIREDRSIHAKGTAVGDLSYFLIANDIYLGTYEMGGGAGQGGTNQAYSISSRLYYNGKGKVSFGVDNGTHIDDVLYPMANKGSRLLPYVPYFDPITFTIPTEITSLPGYGYSMPDGTLPNEVDFDAKVYRQRCEVNGSSIVALPEEVVTPIEQYLTDDMYQSIQVQGGGEIEFITDNNEHAPSTVTFLITP